MKRSVGGGRYGGPPPRHLRHRHRSVPAGAPSSLAWLVAAAAVAVLSAGAASAGGFPVASTGDIWFQADQAAFQDDAGSEYEEYYFRVPNTQFAFEPPDREGSGPWTGGTFIKLTFLDADDSEIGRASRKFEFTAADESAALSPDRVQIFVMREPLHPRTAEVRLEMEDLNARKRGLVYLITDKKRNGVARGSLMPPPFRGRSFGISDLQFAWDIGGDTTGARFAKRGFNVVPNPARIYGLYRDSLAVYYEVYMPQGSGGTFVARQAILDPGGRTLAARVDTVAAPQGSWAHALAVPITGMPAGTFDFEVDVKELGGETRSATARRPFNVVWTEGMWARSEQDVLDEARLILPESEYETFKELPLGDRESRLASFWNAADPSPGTARNERREVFLARVAYADQNFTTGYEKGIRSDRGRVYVRYGAPDEVTREVMPQIGSTLTDVLRGAEEDRPELRNLHSSNADAIDTRPYEIWSYTRQGDPLFIDREGATPNTGLTFIFVDNQGIGNYTLLYSNAFKRF